MLIDFAKVHQQTKFDENRSTSLWLRTVQMTIDIISKPILDSGDLKNPVFCEKLQHRFFNLWVSL